MAAVWSQTKLGKVPGGLGVETSLPSEKGLRNRDTEGLIFEL